MVKSDLPSPRNLQGAAEEFLDKGFVWLPRPKHADILPAIEGFGELIASADERWQGFPVDDSGDHDDAWIHRTGGEHDVKDFFHWRVQLPGLLKGRGIDTGLYPWLETCATLHALLWGEMREFVGAIDDVSSLEGQLLADYDRSDRHVLRLLRYGKQASGVVAKPHTDRAFITVAVAESHPGLRGGAGQPIPFRDNAMFVFAGRKADTRLSVEPFNHWVVDPRLNGAGRWSVVFFAHL